MILGDPVQAFSGVASLDQFQARLQQELAILGFNQLTLGFLPRKLELAPAMPRNLSTYPLEWLLRYEQNRYLFKDPAITRPLRNPHQWFLWHQRQGLSTLENRILDEAAEFGLRVGVCIPALTRSSLGMMALGWDGEATDFEAFLEERRRQLWLLASVAQCTAIQRFGDRFLGDYDVLLNRQQRDLLRWLGDGQSLETIADRMNLSVRTVRERIGGVCRTLGVESPAEALVVARDLWVD